MFEVTGMDKTVDATYDGEVFRPDEPVDLKPNTKVTVVIDDAEKSGESYSFFRVARSLKLTGPSDFSENLDDYLYGGKPFPDEK